MPAAGLVYSFSSAPALDSGSADQRMIPVRNAAGAMLGSYPCLASQLALSVTHLPAGTYFLRVLTIATGATATLRLEVTR
ncbi:hypothetical protein [Hymenobacter sp. DG01]|uniref:hypothetical protein n=1 Tax=Hymenobacter sp. DG01 TaxID=2584940 RepID=UPI00111E5506|nr:hypothetical protein [Hymenobacter sp. DG01]